MSSQGPVRAAYWPSYSGFPPANIDTRYFTHIYYAFVNLDPRTFKLRIEDNERRQFPEFIEGLRNRNPPVKILLAIGGANDSLLPLFSAMASTPENRRAFIMSTIRVAREYGFQGFDLDWEFPQNPQEMENLGSLLREWHQALVSEAQNGRPRLLLTAAVLYTPEINLYDGGPIRAYPAQVFSDYLDWTNLMCYDYHGGWARETGHNAALIPKTQEGVQAWILSGVPIERLVLGLPLYGRRWTLQDPNVHGVGAPAYIPENEDSTMSYSGIVQSNQQNSAAVVYDEQAVAVYSYRGNEWISYDDERSIKKKLQYAREKGMKGYFFWAIGQDLNWTLSEHGIQRNNRRRKETKNTHLKMHTTIPSRFVERSIRGKEKRC